MYKFGIWLQNRVESVESGEIDPQTGVPENALCLINVKKELHKFDQVVLSNVIFILVFIEF